MIPRNILVLLATLWLSGCGFSLGEENAVENMTFAQLLVYSQSLDSDGSDDIERKIDHLRSVTNFDVDVELGDGIAECEALSNHQVASRQVGKEGYLIRSKFDIRGGYSGQLEFIGRGLDLGITTMFTELYLQTVTISGSNGTVFSGDSFEQSSFEMLKMAIVDCNIDRFLVDYANKIEQEKAQAAEAEQARIDSLKENLRAGIFGTTENPTCTQVLQFTEQLDNSVVVADAEAGISRSLDESIESFDSWASYALSQLRVKKGDVSVFRQVASSCTRSPAHRNYVQALKDLPALQDAKVAHEEGLLNTEGRPLSETAAGSEAKAWLANKNKSTMQCDESIENDCSFEKLPLIAAAKASTEYVRCKEGVEAAATVCFDSLSDHFNYTFASMRLEWIGSRLQMVDKQISKVRRSWDYDNNLENCKQGAISEGLRGDAYSDYVASVCEPKVFDELSVDYRSERTTLENLQTKLIATMDELEDRVAD